MTDPLWNEALYRKDFDGLDADKKYADAYQPCIGDYKPATYICCVVNSKM